MTTDSKQKENEKTLKNFNIFLEAITKVAKFKQDHDYQPYFITYEINKVPKKNISELFTLKFKEQKILNLTTIYVKKSEIKNYLLSFFNFMKNSDILSENQSEVFISYIEKTFYDFIYEEGWQEVIGNNCSCGMSTVSKVYILEKSDKFLVLDIGYSD
jgi:hypothetical protein